MSFFSVSEEFLTLPTLCRHEGSYLQKVNRFFFFETGFYIIIWFQAIYVGKDDLELLFFVPLPPKCWASPHPVLWAAEEGTQASCMLGKYCTISSIHSGCFWGNHASGSSWMSPCRCQPPQKQNLYITPGAAWPLLSDEAGILAFVTERGFRVSVWLEFALFWQWIWTFFICNAHIRWIIFNWGQAYLFHWPFVPRVKHLKSFLLSL